MYNIKFQAVRPFHEGVAHIEYLASIACVGVVKLITACKESSDKSDLDGQFELV